MSLLHANRLLELLRIHDRLTLADAKDRWDSLAQWGALEKLLEVEGASLWLHRRLHARGIKPDSKIGDSLRASAHRHLMIGMRVDDEAAAVSAILRDAGIDFALIKGPARRIAAKLYPYADARATSDVDMLVPEAQARDAWEVLRANGYDEVPSQPPPEHFHLPGLWSSRKVGVEIHMSTAPWITPAEAWRRATEGGDDVEWNGATYRVGSATELLWHGMSHSFIDGASGFRLRTFLDGAAVLASGRAIDWELIMNRTASGELRVYDTTQFVAPGMQHRWLVTAATLAGISLPLSALHRPFPLGRLLHWKAKAHGLRVGRAMRERLLEEATRAEYDMPLTPGSGADPLLARGRRRIATTTARLGYLGWRAVAG